MNNGNELVSVIIPTYRATSRLKNAIYSVLNQTYNNLEVIVVDDNNPEDEHRKYTEDIMLNFKDDLRVKYIKHDCNKNGAAARNTGMRASSGTMIAFLDDDDEYYEHRIERCVNTLKKNQEYDAVYTNCDIYIKDEFHENRKAKYSGNIWRELLINEGVLGTGSNLFFRKKCLEEVKEFDERFLRYQDVEFMLRLVSVYKILAINETLVRKNIEITNIPQYPKYRENRLLVFEKFENFILMLSDEERKCFFEINYRLLLNSAIQSENKKYIRQAVADYKKIGKLDLKTRTKCMFARQYNCYLRRRSKQ